MKKNAITVTAKQFYFLNMLSIHKGYIDVINNGQTAPRLILPTREEIIHLRTFRILRDKKMITQITNNTLVNKWCLSVYGCEFVKLPLEEIID